MIVLTKSSIGAQGCRITNNSVWRVMPKPSQSNKVKCFTYITLKSISEREKINLLRAYLVKRRNFPAVIHERRMVASRVIVWGQAAPESGWFPVRLGDEGVALVSWQWRVDVCIIQYEPRVKTWLNELLLWKTLHC